MRAIFFAKLLFFSAARCARQIIAPESCCAEFIFPCAGFVFLWPRILEVRLIRFYLFSLFLYHWNATTKEMPLRWWHSSYFGGLCCVRATWWPPENGIRFPTNEYTQTQYLDGGPFFVSVSVFAALAGYPRAAKLIQYMH